MRYRVISSLMILGLLLLSVILCSCGDSKEYYTPSLIFEERNEMYIVTGISSDDDEIIIPQKYDGKIVQIDAEAFKDCQQLKNVKINCWRIGAGAFENCTNLQSITIGQNVCSIGDSAFANTERLTEIVYLAENIENVLGGTFLNAGNKDNGIRLTIGNNVKMIPGWFFSACEDVYLKSVFWEENSQCTYIGPFAFFSCDDLTSIIIPEKIAYIGHRCFAGCEALKTISFENRQEDWKIYDYRDSEEYIYIVNSDTVKSETEIANKLVFEYNSFDWRR